MNGVARNTLRALRAHGIPELRGYARALIRACDESPPKFGKKAYRDLYKHSAVDPGWVALSLATSAQSEGEGARNLWNLAACTGDPDIAGQIKQHAIDEARHSRGYVTLLELVFPDAADEPLLRQLRKLSPGYTNSSPLAARKGSPYAQPATVDELIQMNIAEIRTRILQLLQRPVLLAYCPPERRARVRRILDSLLYDETRHIAYTAQLIERAARRPDGRQVMALMQERVRDFNAITDNDIASRSFSAA